MKQMPERIERTTIYESEEEYLKLLRTNGTKDGVSILAVLYALQFYK